MAKLNDIKGYWDMSYAHNFNEHNMWEGKILLEEDGWFEGIAVDPNSSYKKDRFIFGVYHPTKVIKLFKFTPIDVSSPFVFHGIKDSTGYDGEFGTIGIFGSMPCGVSHIITQDAELARENVDAEIEELKSKIQSYKDNTMDEVGRSFYDNSIAMRNNMCQIILRNYEGSPFSTEEYQQIMEECQPVNDNVMHATEEAAKKLVKRMPKNLVEDDEGLPF